MIKEPWVKHEAPSFLRWLCVHLAQPLVGRSSCFIFVTVPSCAGTQLCAWMLAAFWRGSVFSAVRFCASVWDGVLPLPTELCAMCTQYFQTDVRMILTPL